MPEGLVHIYGVAIRFESIRTPCPKRANRVSLSRIDVTDGLRILLEVTEVHLLFNEHASRDDAEYQGCWRPIWTRCPSVDNRVRDF
jgi:hypothetical protein